MDYYEILGVPRNASPEEIKKAFDRLAHKYHPHKGGDEKKFKEINEAYQVLSDKEKRAQYDRFGRVFEGSGEGFSGTGFNQSGFEGFDFGFGEPGAGFDFEIDDLFSDFFGFGSRRKTRQRNLNRGDDLEVSVEIDLKDTLTGLKKKIILEKEIVCNRCQGTGGEPGTKVKECFSCRGTGEVQQIKKTIFGSLTRSVVCPECHGEGKIPEKPCNVCHGEGRIRGKEELEVFIPAGVDSGQALRIVGKGDAGRRGGKAGDLYLKIFVKAHPLFQRKGDDLHLVREISFSEAVLGAEIEVPTLDEKSVILKIPAGSESGRVLRVGGRGIPHFSGWGRGDLYIKLVVKIPKKLTKKQKELLENLKKEGL